MITRNLKELLALVLTANSSVMGIRPVKDVTGRMWYASPQFNGVFPYTVSTAVTLDANAQGISIGSGDTAPTERDYNLESTITSGVTLTLTATKAGCDSPSDPYVEYYVTVTNTGDTAITVKEICYKQLMKGVAKVDGTAAGNIVVMMDRTVLSEPMTVQAGDAGVIIYKLKTVPMGGRTVSGIKIVDFTFGTDAEICDMIDAARQGIIDLQEDGGWRVGDQRKISLAAWTGGNDVTHAAEDLTIVISSFEEYNDCGNLFQFDFMDCCTGGQRMNSSNSTFDGYGATEMYTTTLPALVEALPSWLKTRLKTFSVQASKGGVDLTEAETVGDNKLALRSAVEIFGTGGNGKAPEGTQVEYYKLFAVRAKTIGNSGSIAYWWERSANSSGNFCMVSNGGNAYTMSASAAYGVAPFGCI